MEGWEFQFTDGLLTLLGFDDGLRGEWLDCGTYTDDRAANCAGPKMLHIHLDQLSTTAFLWSQMEIHSRLNKKYRRVVNALDSTCAVLCITCIATGAVGTGLLASGIGFMPGLVLEVITSVAGLLDTAGVAVLCRCSARDAKHEAVRVLVTSKLNTVHGHILTVIFPMTSIN